MKIFSFIKKKLTSVKDWFLKSSVLVKIIIVLVIVAIGWFAVSKIIGTKSTKAQYQTTQVTKGTLIVSVTASGQVASTNNTSITTQASGVVSKIYVKDGDTVKAGDKIADIDLDIYGKQKSMSSLASYQSAQNALNSTKSDLYTTQSTMFTKWSTFMDLAQNSTYQNSDGSPNDLNRALPQFHIAQDDWLATEAKYKNQQNVVTQAQTALSSAWYSYQQLSPTIYAPISGKISGLSLQVGSVIGASTTTTTTTSSGSTSSNSSTKIANVRTDAAPTINVNLTEVDAPTVKTEDQATLTFDAFTGKTFTGKVVSIDTAGSVSSGVTSYPATILLDSNVEEIYPNMSTTANIITATKNDVLLVPTAAVQTQNDQTYVRVLKNGKPQQVNVETGLSSSTQIEITSGLSEGDNVITSTVSSTTSGSSTSASPFSSFGRGVGGGIRRD